MPRRLAPLLLVLVLAAAAGWWLAGRGGPPPGRGTVERVVDGDTIIVRAGGSRLDVRLLGIDTPETVDPHRPVGCYGPQASAFAKRLLTGGQVELAYDRELHDRYGRWLAYVYLRRDGRPDLFVNAALVARGYARTLSIPPNTAHAAQLSALERSSALAGRGLWSACA